MPKTKKSGIVQSFNISPKGTYEGLLLESSGEVLQINFPQEWGATVAAIAGPGNHIEAELEPKDVHTHASHPVYELRHLSNDKQERFPLELTRSSITRLSFQAWERLFPDPFGIEPLNCNPCARDSSG